MHIKELFDCHAQQAIKTVPEWMIGCFKRRSISFANGQTDTQTHVFWLQGRNLTIDLRLPKEADQVTRKSWQQCNQSELYQLANYEGWSADCSWNNEQLSWSGGVAFQLHNRWPEPAILSRVGDCMMESSPHQTYIEDWRLKSKSSGPLLSFELIDEINLTTGELRHRGGALIINDNWAGLVLGRSIEMGLGDVDMQLRHKVRNNSSDIDYLKAAFNFETSVAQGNLDEGFDILFSTQSSRLGESLFALEGFEFDPDKNEVIQIFFKDDQQIKRRFTIDTLEPEFEFSSTTSFHPDAKTWFEAEEETLSRYLNALT
jgi:hypothetical protein